MVRQIILAIIIIFTFLLTDAVAVDVLMVVGDTTSLANDSLLRDRMTDRLNYNVTVIDDDAIDTLSNCSDYDGILISWSVTDSKVASLRDTAVGVMLFEQNCYNEFNLATGASVYGEGHYYTNTNTVPYICDVFQDTVGLLSRYANRSHGVMFEICDGAYQPLETNDYGGEDTAAFFVVDTDSALTSGTAVARRSFAGVYEYNYPNESGVNVGAGIANCPMNKLFDRMISWTCSDTANPDVLDELCFFGHWELEACWGEIGLVDSATYSSSLRWGYDSGDDIKTWFQLLSPEDYTPAGYTCDSLVLEWPIYSYGIEGTPADSWEFEIAVYRIISSDWHAPLVGTLSDTTTDADATFRGGGYPYDTLQSYCGPVSCFTDSTWVTRRDAVAGVTSWDSRDMTPGVDHDSTELERINIQYPDNHDIDDTMRFVIPGSTYNLWDDYPDSNMGVIMKLDTIISPADSSFNVEYATAGYYRSFGGADYMNVIAYYSQDVSIPVTSLPDTLDISDTTYQLSGSLHSDGNGILISANNITLDLNGDTIYFGESDDSAWGILTDWGVNNVTIRNGVIINNIDDTVTAYYNRCIHIRAGGSDSISIDTVSATVRGYNGNCVRSIGGRFVTIRGGRYTNDCHGFTSRCVNARGAAIYSSANTLPDPSDTSQYHLKALGVRVMRAPHCGFQIERANSATLNRAIIENCTSMVDVRNDLCTLLAECEQVNTCIGPGDPFNIITYGIEYGSRFNDNVLMSGTDNYGGDGMLVQQVHGSSDYPVEIKRNEMTLWHGQHPGGAVITQHCVGLYFRNPEVAENKDEYNQYVEFKDNTIEIYVDALGSTEHIGSRGEGLRILISDSSNFNEFERNRVFVLRSDSTERDSGSVYTHALSIARADTVWSGDVYSSPYSDDNIFRYNYYEAERHPLTYGSWRESYLCANRTTMIGDTFNTVYEVTDSSGILFLGIGTYRYRSVNNRVIDPTFLGYMHDTAVNFDDFNEYIDSCDDYAQGKEVSFERIVNILILDSTDLPIHDADVWIVNNYGDTVSSGQSGEDGIYTDTVPYKYYGYSHWDDCPLPDSTYNDFLFGASYVNSGATMTQTIAAEWDGIDTIELLDSVGGVVKKYFIGRRGVPDDWEDPDSMIN